MTTTASTESRSQAPGLLDGSALLHGPNLLHSHTVSASYVGVLERVLATAVADGEITQKQVDGGYRGAFAQPDGCLFVCLCASDQSNLMYGTSIPAFHWWPK